MTGRRLTAGAKGRLRGLTWGLRDRQFRDMARGYDIQGYRRIYLVHVRKTGGTSLNYMFLSTGGQDGSAVYDDINRSRPHRVVRDGRIFVGWDIDLINRGDYFYAFSHTPLHQASPSTRDVHADLPARPDRASPLPLQHAPCVPPGGCRTSGHGCRGAMAGRLVR